LAVHGAISPGKHALGEIAAMAAIERLSVDLDT
jgi:hypothetical protein